ncbi:MAG: long-chain fatty acid--CoA ligase [Noviherbaspirillum sp.]
MSTLHYRYWPRGVPKQLHVPQTSLYHNLEVAAARFPDKAAIVFYDSLMTYGQLKREVDVMAGFLQQRCGVKKGDRVLLDSQNCPQFVVAYYAILRADAVVVPVNAMSTAGEIEHYVTDSGAAVAFIGQELYRHIQPLVGEHGVRRVVVLTYSDYLTAATDLNVPEAVREPGSPIDDPAVTSWNDAMAARLVPGAHTAGKDDLCLLPYTSGTTGRPKGCMHTHRTLMKVIASTQIWRGLHSESILFAIAPLFHLLGMQNGMNMAILMGATVVMMTRWDRDAAAALVERYRVSVWGAPPAMLLDFFANPELNKYDLSSLALLFGGGAAMPEAVAAMLKDKFGLTYNEGYGMTETASGTHTNPLHRPKRQCLGMPTLGVDSRVVDPVTLRELPPGEVGEIVTHADQMMKGYWNNPKADAEAFAEIDGKRFLRTGDLGYVDEEGYFFMCDRLKRMINASGFKVWPAEVENAMYDHPAVHEACVIAAQDARRGETVKAVLVLKPGSRGKVSEEEIIAWCRERMAAYKAPRIVRFVDSLPKSGTGKILWRELQEQERVAGINEDQSHASENANCDASMHRA